MIALKFAARCLDGRGRGFQHLKYSVSVIQQQRLDPAPKDVVLQLEHDGARILRIVKKRLDARANLLSQARSLGLFTVCIS